MVKKLIAGTEYPSSSFLVVEDPEGPSTWHLQVKDESGKPDHRLMGAAWAALHGGYRGNKYEGPNKAEALAELKKMYEDEQMPLPTEKAIAGNDAIIEIANLMQAQAQIDAIKTGIDAETVQRLHDLTCALGAECEMEDDSESEDSVTEMERHGFTTFKASDGRTRWLAVSSTAYQDHDKQIVSTKALEDDVERTSKDSDFGPLRWRHIGQPDAVTQKAGPGLDVGDCDFSTVYGKMLVESGTFRDERIAAKVAAGGPYEISLGFFHPANQPDKDGVFHKIKRFERSLLPTGRASNLFTSFDTIGGTKMADKEKAKSDLRALLGDELANQVTAQLDEKEKTAAKSGVSFKERLDSIFAVLRGEQPKAAEVAPAPVATVKDYDGVIAALKEATINQADAMKAQSNRIGELEVTLKSLLDELEALAGKPGYRPTKDAETVVATKADNGENGLTDFLSRLGGAK